MKYHRLLLLNKNTSEDIFNTLKKHPVFTMYILFGPNVIADKLISKKIFSHKMKLLDNCVMVYPEDLDGKQNVIDLKFNLNPNSIKDAIFLYEV